MNDLLHPPTAGTAATTGPVPAPAAQPLVIGVRDLADKEQLVLRSLIRLLDGRDGLRLQHADSNADCNVVFVGGSVAPRLPGRCVTVHVAGDGAESSTGLAVAPPLRISNVMAVLHLAARLLADAPPAAGGQGLPALFDALSRHFLARERRTTVLPLSSGGQITIDFVAERYCATATPDELLGGRYHLGEPRRATTPEHDAVRAFSALSLRDLVWQAAHRLADEGVAAPALPGPVRLRRWPDAIALARPGVPRLSALLTSRAMHLPQAEAESGMPANALRWFLHACLALGIAVPADDAPVVAHPVPVRVAAAPRSLLVRLRERLKLW